MRCPKCGGDNPAALEFCAKCGNRLERRSQEDLIPKARKTAMPFLAFAAIAVTAIILAPTVVYFYLSPDYSWNASIRDSDGDGFPDNVDIFPDNSSEWYDTDSDGVGDNADLLPFHNAVVVISVDLYIGDGTSDTGDGEDGTSGDPYFVIGVSIDDEDTLPIEYELSEQSDVFYDTEKLLDGFSMVVDIDDDQGDIDFSIHVYDDDSGAAEPIDASIDDNYYHVFRSFAYPFTRSFVAEGDSDGPKCLLVYSLTLTSDEAIQ